MSTDFNFDFDDDKKDENRIHSASEIDSSFDFDDDFLNNSSSSNNNSDNDFSFKEESKQGVSSDFSLDFEEETESVKKDSSNDFSLDFDVDNKDSSNDSFNIDDNSFSLENEKENSFDFIEPVQAKNSKPEKEIKREENKKFNSFNDMDMDEHEELDRKVDRKVDISSKFQDDEEIKEKTPTQKGLFMARQKKEEIQEEVFDDDETYDEDNIEEEQQETKKPIFLQKWFIPTVGGICFAAFIGVKMMNGGLGGGQEVRAVQQQPLTTQNTMPAEPPPMFENQTPQTNSFQEQVTNQQPYQQQEEVIQQPIQQQPIAIQPNNDSLLKIANEQLEQKMQETHLKINNQNIRLDRIENNINQISNNMVLIATSLTELKNTVESKQQLASKENVKVKKESSVDKTDRVQTEKHVNNYHRKINSNTTYTAKKSSEPPYGNVKMAINGSAWVVNGKGETIELHAGDYNSQYGKILSIDENGLMVRTSKGILRSNY